MVVVFLINKNCFLSANTIVGLILSYTGNRKKP